MSNPKEGAVSVVNVEFLRTASIATLQQYELSKRNSAANFAQQFKTLLHRVIDDMVEADLAAMAIKLRQGLGEPAPDADPFRLDR